VFFITFQLIFQAPLREIWARIRGITLQISRSARFKLHKKRTLSAGHKPYLAIWFGIITW